MPVAETKNEKATPVLKTPIGARKKTPSGYRHDTILIVLVLVLYTFFIGSYLLRAVSGRNEFAAELAAPMSPSAVCRRMDDLFTANMPGKKSLAAIRNGLKFLVFRRSGHPLVKIGKDGWMMWCDDATLKSFKREDLFEEGELRQWQLVLDDCASWAQRNGTEFAFIITPDKFTTYAEFSPEGLVPKAGKSRADQFVEYMAKHSKARVIDLRPVLAKGRETERVYYITDTHWNEYGAFLGYSEIVKQIPRLAAVKPLTLKDFSVKHAQYDAGDIAANAGIAGVVPDIAPFLTPNFAQSFEIADDSQLKELRLKGSRDLARVSQTLITQRTPSNLPKLLVFHDSFAMWLEPYLSHHASRARYEWSDQVTAERWHTEKPDVVLYEMTERFLTSPPPPNPELSTNVSGSSWVCRDPKADINPNNCTVAGQIIESKTRDPQLLLRGQFSSRRDKLLSISIDQPEPTPVQVFWTTGDKQNFSDKLCVTRHSSSPAFTANFRIPASAVKVRIDPGSSIGRYTLRRLTIAEID